MFPFAPPQETMDLVGIGIGPANLSLAALLRPHPELRSRFFERRNEFVWHAGLMLPNAAIQVSYLKDLVSLVDPTNQLSFLSFLAKHKRLLSFINANFQQVLRREFNQYYRWACEQLPSLHFGREVESVEVQDDLIVLSGSNWTQPTRNLVLGTGLAPMVPDCAKPWLGATMLHASQYLFHNHHMANKRVVVVGGGQTGAEIFQRLVSDTAAMPASLTWVSRRLNFFPLDESPFTNELYTPEYADYFFGLRAQQRRRLLIEQTLASDGISAALLQSIYQRVYELRYLAHHPCDIQLRPARELIEIAPYKGGWQLTLCHLLSDTREVLHADIVVLCTGYEYRLPACLDPIVERIRRHNGEFAINDDFSIEWDGPSGCRMYVQNAARAQRGIADPNLGLIPWRCAKIINSVAQQTVYDLTGAAPFISWDAQGQSAREENLDLLGVR
jgi:lysine N6-hydroxylase